MLLWTQLSSVKALFAEPGILRAAMTQHAGCLTRSFLQGPTLSAYMLICSCLRVNACMCRQVRAEQ